MNHLIPPPPLPSVPVLGTRDRFPVRRIYCVGRNYSEHAREMGFTEREDPFFFMKPADAVLPVEPGELGLMEYPPLTANLHHEAELVVAIGRAGRDVPVDQAMELVHGYAPGLDMTRRDLQDAAKKSGRPWCIAKAFHQSAPIGAIVPREHAGELVTGSILLDVNGVTRQRGDLGDLIWKVPEILHHLSKAWDLAPGDLVFTGTPAGVGSVDRGDLIQVTVEIGKVGAQLLKIRIL